MKIKTMIFLGSMGCLVASCQKATLIESMEEEMEADGRSDDTEPKDSTTTVIPDFTTEGWGEPIDVNFGFGGDK